jgi:hypothetical protein
MVTLCVLSPCRLQAQAFAVSGRESRATVRSYAFAVADAINTGGEEATTAYAAAFSAAYAGAHAASCCFQQENHTNGSACAYICQLDSGCA